MKKLLPFMLLLMAMAMQAQEVGFPRYQSANPGFPYNEDAPIASNNAIDTTSSMQRVRRLINVLSEFRFQAYVQEEWQRTDTAGSGYGSNPKLVGVQGGQFPTTANNRFLTRRARFKFSYEHKNAKDLKIFEFAFQFDATEKGFNAVKDAYGRIIDPWTGWFGLQGGIFLRPFGFESPAPPAFYESPEFSRVNQTVIPNECELGEGIVIESPAKFTPLYLRIDAFLVNGEGVGQGSQTGTYQSEKDFNSRIKAGKAWNVKGGSSQPGGSTFGANLTFSDYSGGVMQGTYNVYEVENGAFTNVITNHADSSQILRKFWERQYFGASLELKADYYIGTTTLRGEYIGGIQPGTSSSSSVPLGTGNAEPTTSTTTNVTVTTPTGTAVIPVTTVSNGVDLYIRHFSGAMFYFVQSFKNHMKKDGHVMYHDLTFKFDFYNPNTSVKQIDLTTSNHFNATDVEYSTFGFGYSFIPYNWFKLMIWYDHVVNASTGITGFRSDYGKDDVLTIRTQFYIDTKWFGSKSKYTDNLMQKQY